MEINAKSKRRLSLGKSKRLILENESLQNENYGDQKLDRWGSINCSFEQCRFDNIVIKDACFGEGQKMSVYTKCTFDGSDLRSISPGGARFVGCSFKNVNIREFIGTNTEFVDCIFSGKLKKCVFNASLDQDDQKMYRRKVNEFSGNDFSAAIFDDVGFSGGIDLTKQKLPIDDSHTVIADGEEFIKKIRRRYLGEKDIALRKKVFGMLNFLEYEVSNGQNQLYFCKDDIPEGAQQTILSFL